MADNVRVRQRFRGIAERARRIPEALGQRPTKVTVRVRIYTGSVAAQGTTLSSTADTVLSPRPKVRQVSDGQKSHFGGGRFSLATGQLAAAVYEIGPITQAWPGGGYAPDDLVPAGGVDRRVTVLLEGDAFTDGGEEFAIDGEDFARPQSGWVRVVRTRQGA